MYGRWCQGEGIAVTAYGSLGSSSTGGRNASKVAEASILRSPSKAAESSLEALAARHGVTTANLLLGWALARGCAVIPGATSATHIRENLHLRRVRLSGAEEAQLAGARRPDTWRLWRNMKCAPGDRGGCAREESK